MGATTALSESVLVVEPGGEARTSVRVRNTGTVVDQFDIEVSDGVAGWTTALPSTISLLPGHDQVVEIAFHPPKSADVIAGERPFAIRARSHEDPDGSSVVEGTIDVRPYDDRSAELIPRASQGRRAGRHEIAVDNRGNAPITINLNGIDPEGTARFEFSPEQLTVAPGTAQFATLKVTPDKTFWRGPNKTRPFAVFATGDEQPPIPLDGSMVQIALLPKWFWKAVLATMAVFLLLAVAWFALVKPQIKTSAKEVIAPLDERLDAASIPELPTTVPGGGDGGGDDGGGGGGGGATTTTSPDSDTVPPVTGVGTTTTNPDGGGDPDGQNGSNGSYGTPFAFRLEVDSGSSPSASYTVPAGQTFALTDTIFQNPQGDTGTLTLSRNGDVLLELNLQNIRLNDQHMIAPIIFAAGDTLMITVQCEAAGPGGPTQCADAATLSGFLQ